MHSFVCGKGLIIEDALIEFLFNSIRFFLSFFLFNNIIVFMSDRNLQDTNV